MQKNDNRGLLTSDKQQFRIVMGLCRKSGTISFESLAKPGYFLRHQEFEIYLHEKENSDLYRDDACFRPRYNKYFPVKINLLLKCLLCFY